MMNLVRFGYVLLIFLPLWTSANECLTNLYSCDSLLFCPGCTKGHVIASSDPCPMICCYDCLQCTWSFDYNCSLTQFLYLPKIIAKVMASIVIFILKKYIRMQISNYERTDFCAICLDQNLNLITHCEHEFHAICLVQWAKRKSICPLCQANLGQVNLYCTICHRNYKKINLKNTEAILSVKLCDYCAINGGGQMLSI